MGYGKALLNHAIAFAQKKGEHMMYLNANPTGYSGMNLNTLVGFYQSMGFEIIVDDKHNKEMIRRI